MTKLTFTREEALKAIGGIVLLCGAWYGAEARIQRVEDKSVTQEEKLRDMRDDIKEIRRDVKSVVRSVGEIERRVK